MQLLVSERPNQRTKLTIWQQATMIHGDHTHDHSIIACSHHFHMGAILCPHLTRGEPCIQRRAKKWQQNHSLQNFAQTGFLLEKVLLN